MKLQKKTWNKTLICAVLASVLGMGFGLGMSRAEAEESVTYTKLSHDAGAAIDLPVWFGSDGSIYFGNYPGGGDTPPVTGSLMVNTSVAIGNGASASGASSNAIGHGAVADGASSNAIGDGAQAHGNSSNAIGDGAMVALGATNSNAIGDGAQADGESSNAIGYMAQAYGVSSNAIGNGAQAYGFSSNAIGDGAQASGESSNAIGDGAYADLNATNSIAIGTDARAMAIGSVALGSNSLATEANTVSVGNSTVQRRIVNVANGTADHDAATVGQLKDSISFIAYIKSGSFTSPAAGGGINSLAIGNKAHAFGYSSNAIGDGAQVRNNYSNAIGREAYACGESSNAIGNGAQVVAVATNSNAIGNGALASGASSNAIGDEAFAQGNYSNAIGDGAQVAGGATNSNAIGKGACADINATNSNAIGYYAEAKTTGSVALGALSVANRTDLGTNVYELSVGRPELTNGSKYTDTTANAVYRVITNVADGTEDHDAATVGQVKGALGTLTFDSDNKKLKFTNLGAESATEIDLSSLAGGSTGGSTGGGTPICIAFGLNGTSSELTKAEADGINAVAIGNNAKANAYYAIALGSDTMAISNAVALGALSVAERDLSSRATDNEVVYELSVGRPALTGEDKYNDGRQNAVYRVITNVADGTDDHDAATVGQLKDSISFIACDKPNSFTSPIATNTDSLAIGDGAEARGFYSNAIGRVAYASGESSNAVGNRAQASGASSNAIGEGACATALSSNAIGDGAVVRGNYSNAIGEGAVAHALSSNAIGDGATVAGGATNSNAIGAGAFVNDNATNSNAIGAGACADVNAKNSNAIGYYAEAKTTGSVALGALSVANRDLSSRVTDNEVVYELSVGRPELTNGLKYIDETANAVYRVITNVADGTEDHDAATVGQVYSAVGNAFTGASDSKGLRFDATNGKLVTNVPLTTTNTGTNADAFGDTEFVTKAWVQENAGGTGGSIPDFIAYNKGSFSLPTAGAVDSLAIGNKAMAEGLSSNAIGNKAMAGGSSSNAIGAEAMAVGLSSNAIGNKAMAGGSSSNAIGNSASVAVGATNSNAIGNGAQALLASSNAIGYYAKAGTTGSVALGAWSVAERGNLDANVYELSVGRPALTGDAKYDDGTQNAVYRVITNVAAGTADTDAATVGQVYSAVGNAFTGASDSKGLRFDATNGKLVTNVPLTTTNTGTNADAFGDTEFVTKAWVQENAGGTGGTTYTAGNGLVLADNGTFSVSADSSDFSFNENKQLQLNKSGTVANDDTGIVTGGTVYTALQNYATKGQLDATEADLKNEISMTEAKAGAAQAELSWRISPYITSDGLSANSSRIKNVSNGMADNDAATYGQVKNSVNSLSFDSTNKKIAYTTIADGTIQYLDLSSLAGSAGGSTGGGTVPDYIAVVKPEGGSGAVAYGTGSVALGYNTQVIGASGTTDYSIALGYSAKVTSAAAIAMGYNAAAEGLRSVAIGGDSKATANYSVAIGYSSVASEEHTVSVGNSNEGGQRRIVNVADGTADHDAATYGQVKNAVGALSLSLSDDNKLSLMNGQTALKTVDLSGLAGGTGGGSVDAYTKAETDAKYGVTLTYADNKLSLKNAAGTELSSVTITAGQTVDISGKADKATTLEGYGITDAYTKTETYSQTEVNTELAKKANVTDVYTKTEVDSALDNKANTADVYSKTETDTKLNGKADKATTLQGYGIMDAYTKTEVDSALGDKADKTYVDTELGKKADAATSLAGYGITDAYTKTEADAAFSTKSYVDNAIAAIGGGGVIVPADDKVAYGLDNQVAEQSTAMGHGISITGENSVAVGAGHRISGKNAGAFGDPSYIDADSSYGIGNSNTIQNTATGSFAVGNNNYIAGENTFVLGSGVGTESKPVASKNAVILGNGSTEGGDNTVSVGSSAEGGQRKIVNVADGEYATDAATVGQLYSATGRLGTELSRMGGRLNKVGAGAAALAAMHPVYDEESKLTFSAGVGNYKNQTAAAVGMFYRFDDRTMLNFGASVGNDNDMYNMGLNFALGHHVKKGLPSKEVLHQEIISLQTLLEEQKAENAAMKQENDSMRQKMLAQDAKMAAYDAKVAAQDVKIEQLTQIVQELLAK